MPNYRRWRVEGGVYFFTIVTHQRRPILTTAVGRRFLRHAMIEARRRRPFEQLGIVLLPEHIHMIWRLPDGDVDYSIRIGAIKESFTRDYLASGGAEGASTPGRRRQRYRGVWQKRFIEHCIRDWADFKRHLDYIHANPVKHGHVEYPRQWSWSSFHRYRRMGWYENDWCGRVDLPGNLDVEPEGL